MRTQLRKLVKLRLWFDQPPVAAPIGRRLRRQDAEIAPSAKSGTLATASKSAVARLSNITSVIERTSSVALYVRLAYTPFDNPVTAAGRAPLDRRTCRPLACAAVDTVDRPLTTFATLASEGLLGPFSSASVGLRLHAAPTARLKRYKVGLGPVVS